MADETDVPVELTVDGHAEIKTQKIVASWSANHQDAWANVYPQDPIALRRLYGRRPPGLVSRKNVAVRVDAFLRFIGRDYPADAGLPFAENMTAEKLLYYTDELIERSAKEETVHEYVDDVIRYAKRCDPTLPIVALRQIAKLFKPRRKGSAARPPFDSYALFLRAEKTLLALEREIAATPLPNTFIRDSRLEKYRNVLIVALLCLMPLRLRNLTELLVGDNLRKILQGYRVSISAEGMKARQPLNERLPQQLVLHVEFYLERVRPHLGPGVNPKAGRFLIGFLGSGLSGIGVHQIIQRVTLAYLGVALSAHVFRYMFGDTAARAGVQLIRIGAALHHAKGSAVTEGYVKDRNMSALAANRARMTATFSRRALGDEQKAENFA